MGTTFYNSKTTVTIGGKEYYAQLAKIDRTALGYEDHGIFTAMLGCNFGSQYTTAGGYGLDQPFRDEDGNFIERIPTAYGMAWIIKVMNVLEVNYWEDIKGIKTFVLMDGPYGPPVGFANPFDSSKYFIFQDLADEYFPKESNDNKN